MISDKEIIEFLKLRYYFDEDSSLITKILQKYPECRYSGEAYRAVILQNGEKLQKKMEYFIHTSWSPSVDGVLQFLHTSQDEIADRIDEVYLFEARIEGLDLKKLINCLSETFYKLPDELYMISKENEVLSLTVTDLNQLNSHHYQKNLLSPIIEDIYEILMTQDNETWYYEEINHLLNKAIFLSEKGNLEILIPLKKFKEDFNQKSLENEEIQEFSARIYNLI